MNGPDLIAPVAVETPAATPRARATPTSDGAAFERQLVQVQDLARQALSKGANRSPVEPNGRPRAKPSAAEPKPSSNSGERKPVVAPTPERQTAPQLGTPVELELLLRREATPGATATATTDASVPSDAPGATDEVPVERDDARPGARSLVAAPEALLLGAAPLPAPTELIDTKPPELKAARTEDGDAGAKGIEHATKEEPREPVGRELIVPAQPEFRAPEPQPQLTVAPPPADTAPTPLVAAPGLAELPRAPLEDPTLQLFVNPHAARLTVETADAGKLSVQLRVNDGIADIRATGPLAPLIEQRQGELRVALAQQGLAMGQFDLTQSRSGQQQQREDAEPERRRAAPTPTKSTGPAHSGRLSIKA